MNYMGGMRDLNYKDKFIGIWACTSSLHLTEMEGLETFKKYYKVLKKMAFFMHLLGMVKRITKGEKEIHVLYKRKVFKVDRGVRFSFRINI